MGSANPVEAKSQAAADSSFEQNSPVPGEVSQQPSTAKRHTTADWIRFFLVLTVSAALYAGAYVSLITPYPPKIEPIRGDFQREAWYFERGYLDSVAEVFFAPAHYIDVLIRPDYWNK